MVFQQRWSDAELIQELRRVAADVPDRSLTIQLVAEQSAVSWMTWKRRLGPSWTQVLAAAGLQDRYSGTRVTTKMRTLPSRSMTDAEILLELRKLANTLGDELCREDVVEHSQVLGLGVLQSRFGSFSKAMRAANLRPSRRGHRPI